MEHDVIPSKGLDVIVGVGTLGHGQPRLTLIQNFEMAITHSKIVNTILIILGEFHDFDSARLDLNLHNGYILELKSNIRIKMGGS